MLSRLRRRGPPPVLTETNFSPEHASLAQTIDRRRRLVRKVWDRIPLIRGLLVAVAVSWLLALPYHGLWKETYVDENAIQPAQVTLYFDWGNVHKADRYLDTLERIVNDPFEQCCEFLIDSFRTSGLSAGNTSTSVYAHVRPPRSAGTETILLSANWVSRDGTPNLRGVAMLLSLGDFLRGQNHWAFDFVLVVGDGYLYGLEGFMRSYHDIFPGVIWTALNLDYPGHSFSHLGLFYEGVNGRLPNQDVLNTVSHVARWAGGVTPRIHDLDDSTPDWVPASGKDYFLAGKHLWRHFRYTALGLPSGGHGVLAKHRIDSVTMYASPASGPHGFYTLGKTVESTLRSLNNLLERLHASYFFYLIPQQDRFIPVGHYLPIAVLLGASITIGGFDCPSPLQGLLWFLPAFALGIVGWYLQTPVVVLSALTIPQPKGEARKSLISLAYLFYGAIIPTLAMVNFPQAILLAFLCLNSFSGGVLGSAPGQVLLYMSMEELRLSWVGIGNLAWPGVFALLVPLWTVSAMLR